MRATQLTPPLCMQGSSFIVGLAFWPGGTVEDWGPPDDTGLHPCNTTVQANLVRVLTGGCRTLCN